MAQTNRKETRSSIMPSALDPEVREKELISLAMNRAEQQIRDGTASSQTLSHFLKLGTTNALLEREKLVNENELLKAKRENLQSQKRSEELFEKAIAVMKDYGGHGEDSAYDDDEYDDY